MSAMRAGWAILVGLAVSCVGATADEAPRPDLLGTVFDQPRSESEDVIFFRNKDVLRGTVLNETLGVDTPYGEIRVALRKCAGVSFEGSRANTEALVTVNRNRLTGIIADRVIRFRIGTSGEELEIRKEKIQFILLRKSSTELDFIDPKKPRDLFVMTNGDLLTGKPAEARIAIATDYGLVNVGFDEIRQVEMQGGENVTAVVTKKNKDVLRGTLQTEEITLRLDLGTSVERVYKDKFAKVFVEHVPDEMATHFGVLEPVRGESEGALRTDPWPASTPREIKLDLGGGVFMEFVFVPAGEFKRGSPDSEAGRDSDEGPQHTVRLTRGFYIGKFEVTQGQWQAVMGSNPSKFTGDLNRPVEQVSWHDCLDFCGKLSARTGKLVRLPTEAEWEYACRAGGIARFSFGDSDDELEKYAWYKGNSRGETRRVGSRLPNAWGIHDMHGNVWEWCQDWYGPYPLGSVVDPTGLPGGEARVLRGGSWNAYPTNCRAANRYRNTPGYRSDVIGVRVVVSGASAGTP